MDRNYEQEYKKAFEAAKGLHDAGNALTKKQMEIVFPQLAESEDKRIARAINNMLPFIPDEAYANNGVTKEDVLTWLEKQKENPKSSDSIPSDCTADAKYEDRWHKATDSLPDNGREVLAKDKLGNTLLARYDGEGWDVSMYDDDDYRCHNGISKWCEIPSEKQKEQKPTEINFKALLTADRLASAEMTGRLKERSEILENPEKYGLQKPAEWSEEDEEVMEDLYNFVISDFIQDHIHETRWKPWKTTLERNRQNRLKSLRPQTHWKPSEEQMKALSEAVYTFDGYEESDAIKSLYNDLKKLM